MDITKKELENIVANGQKSLEELGSFFIKKFRTKGEGEKKYDAWAVTNELNGISAVRKQWNRIIQHLTEEYLSNDALQKIIDGQRRFKNSIPQFKSFVNSGSKSEKSTPPEPFEPEYWYVYFLHLVHSQHHDKPRMGRAILKKVDDENCELMNTKVAARPDYTGTYSITRHYIENFELECSDGKRDTRLYIKTYPTDQEIAMGLYVTFEHGNLVKGNVIVQKLPGKPQIEKGTVLSPNNSKEWQNIHPGIRKYLSLRRLNYHPVPNLDTLDRLEEYFDDAEFTQWPHTRLMPVNSKPAVFLAYNSSLNPKDGGQSIIHKISDFMEDEMKVPKDCILTIDNAEGNFDPKLSLHRIKQSALFICLADDEPKMSFSSIQIGWALGYSMRTLLFYKKGTISSRVESVCSKHFSVDDFQNEKDLNKIKATIQAQYESLPC